MARGDILRLIDANANRAREALRVLEDYARFIAGDVNTTEELKRMRHRLTVALKPVLRDAILHRDISSDVGTEISTPTEMQRDDLSHVVIAAGKRLGEALRSLEEYLKIDHPVIARQVEGVRYMHYEVERSLAYMHRLTHVQLAEARLYVLITESACRLPWQDVARAAVEGGADILQLREKELEGGELLDRARWLVDLCRPKKVLCIINDRVDIALASNADGVHLGQGDLPAKQARRLLGHYRLLGVSTHAIAQANQAWLDGADYVGAGPVFKSPTKPREIEPGLPYLEQLKDAPRPVFAIAGITEANLPQVLATGCNRVAVTSAVTGSDDPAGACRRMKEMLLTPGS